MAYIFFFTCSRSDPSSGITGVTGIPCKFPALLNDLDCVQCFEKSVYSLIYPVLLRLAPCNGEKPLAQKTKYMHPFCLIFTVQPSHNFNYRC